MTPNSNGKFGILIFISIIILLVVLFLFWFFLFRDKGVPTGGKCSIDSNCIPGDYCGGGGQCVVGPGGLPIGGVCIKNAECQNGSLCVNGKCTNLVPITPTGTKGTTGVTGTTNSTVSSSVSSLVGPVGVTNFNFSVSPVSLNGPVGPMGSTTNWLPIKSFTDKVISVVINDSTTNQKTYYLEVSSMGSTWIEIPLHSYDYDETTSTLISFDLNNGVKKLINIASNGQLISNNFSHIRTSSIIPNSSSSSSSNMGPDCFRRNRCSGPGACISIVDNGMGLLMIDKYNNVLSVGQGAFFPLALFNDRLNYPQVPTNIVTKPVMFEISNPPFRASNPTSNTSNSNSRNNIQYVPRY